PLILVLLPTRPPPPSPLFPYTTLFRSHPALHAGAPERADDRPRLQFPPGQADARRRARVLPHPEARSGDARARGEGSGRASPERDRKSTRLNSSHDQISYAVFCLKKKK